MSARAPESRPAAFAGSWYPGEAAALRRAIVAALPPDAVAAPALAVVAPHAGYRYSLGVAAAAYAAAEVPALCVVLCPNHRARPPFGRGSAGEPAFTSVWPGGGWETPLGEVPVDAALVEAILAACPGVTAETAAHTREHAVELQLPILQVRRPDLRLVALVVADPRPAGLRALGAGLAGAIRDRGEPVLLVASTDMTHFEPAAVARARDGRALARVVDLDPDGLLDTCEREGITMCGVRPTAAVLHACRVLGAGRVESIRYGHSGEASGDDASVVGYAGLVVRPAGTS